MRSILLGAVLAISGFSLASAQTAVSASDKGQDAVASAQASASAPGLRQVYICDGGEMTRRSFSRQHGAVEFVSAEQVLSGQEVWAVPKCMRTAEHARLKRLQSAQGR